MVLVPAMPRPSSAAHARLTRTAPICSSLTSGIPLEMQAGELPRFLQRLDTEYVRELRLFGDVLSGADLVERTEISIQFLCAQYLSSMC
jgi:hypothetical protein